VSSFELLKVLNVFYEIAVRVAISSTSGTEGLRDIVIFQTVEGYA
jgi:hypothetical protein